MSLSLFKRIIRQCKGKVFQVALGGRGNPNEHPDFEEMLKFCRKNDVVPNYTTSGLGLTDEQVELTKKYCGAVAVSEHFQDYTREAIRKFINAGVTTNIHYVLNNASINKALWKLINTDFDNDVNAVIFLLHKPVGQGTDEQVLKIDDPIVPAFFEAVDEHEGSFKVGFDSCSIPGIVNFNKNIDPKSIDTCEGARFSAYITPDGIMTPCSFDQDKEYGNDLNVMSVKEVWDSELFNMFRFSLASSCLDCHDRKLCMGGCPLEREIVLCGREEKKYFKEF
jgi:radical SAM protein with 4Fe4S-binding SPASM domain